MTSPFNRTSMELKLYLVDDHVFQAVTFNRTSMELKQPCWGYYFRKLKTFNRTSMELKRSHHRAGDHVAKRF